MRVKTPLAIPAGGHTYLRFNHWYAFDYDLSPATYYDGGRLLLNGGDTDLLPWVNGPNRRLAGTGSENGRGFGGVSAGYTSSRVDLSRYAGSTITPQFEVLGDSRYSVLGWYVDDVEVYTCGAELTGTVDSVGVVGGASSAKVSWTPPSYAGDGITGYRVTGTYGLTRTLPSTARTTTFTGLKPSTGYSFTVRALNAEGVPGEAASVLAYGTRLTLGVARSGTRSTKVSVKLLNHLMTPLAKRKVAIQRQRANRSWGTVKTVTTGSKGTYAVVLSGRSRASYRLVVAGATALIGSTSASKHL
jgi:bacillolysin